MNTDLAQKYLTLITDLRAFIEQTHPKGSRISTDADTYAYFATLATGNLSKAKQPLAHSAKLAPPSLRTENSVRTPPVTYPAPPKISPPSSPPASEKVSPPPPQPKQEPIDRQPPPSIKFVREAPTAPAYQDFTELRTFFKKELPGIPLSDTIKDDSAAKAIATRWKTPPSEIVILSFNELPKEHAFLKNLCFALNQCLASTTILSAGKIENEKGWEKLLTNDTLRLVVAGNHHLHTMPELLRHFREDGTGKHTLGKINLHLLSDLSVYMQQPNLKSSLWTSLCRLFR